MKPRPRNSSSGPTEKVDAQKNGAPRKPHDPEWEAHLCELEFRQTTLEAENQSLRDANQRLEVALRCANRLQNFGLIGIASLDKSGSILDINDTGAILLGQRKSSLFYNSLASLFDGKGASRFTALLQRCRKSRVPQTAEFEVTLERSRTVSLEITLNPSASRADHGPCFEVTLSDVTQRKLDEADLRLSEETLRALVEASPHPIQFKDARGRWLLANSAALDLFDLRGVDYRFKTDEDLANTFPLCRLALEMRQGADHAALQKGQLIRGNEVAFAVDGAARFFDVLRVPLSQPNGTAKGLVILGYDITDRQLYEEKLRKAHDELEHRVQERTAELRETLERVNDLYHNAPCGYHSLDEKGVYVDVNNTELRWLGYTREELIGKRTPFELQTPRSQVKDRAAFEQLIGQGFVRDVELEFVRRDGSVLPVLLSASAVRDEQGGFVRSRAAMLDITARKQAERALRDSEQRLKAILDNSPSMIFLKDTRGRYLHFNREFERVFEVSLVDSIGKTDAQIFPGQRVRFASHDPKVLKEGLPVQFDEVTVFGDEPHTHIVTRFPIHDAEGTITAIGGILTDITERKRLEEEVLRVSEREQQRIAQDLHDGLGQELAGLWCVIEVLRKDLRARSATETATADQIAELLQVSLNHARSLARGLHPVAVETNGLMSALEDFARTASALFRVPCRFRCPHPVLLEDNTAATHLFRIAQEAVNNAMKHGKAKHIEIRLSSSSRGVTLSVCDDGIGFPKSHAPREGMGLRIMNYRADMIGGRLQVRPRPRGGLEVTCHRPWPDNPEPHHENGTHHGKKRKETKNLHRGGPSRLPRRSRRPNQA